MSDPTGAPAPAAIEPTPRRSDSDVARDLYDPVLMYGDNLKSSFQTLGDRTGIPQAELDAAMVEAANTFADAQLSPTEAGRIQDMIVGHLENPPDDETVHKWEVQTRRMMREKYGTAGEAERRTARVKEFLSHRPTMRKALDESGVGSHPDVVMRLMEQADKFRIQPRPTKAKKS